jgi:hypothetical protein
LIKLITNKPQIQGVTEKSAFILNGNSLQLFEIKFLETCKIELPFVPPLFSR